MALHQSDHHILAAAFATNAFAEHAVGFANAGRVAEKQLEDALPLLRSSLFQPLLRGFVHAGLFSHGHAAESPCSTICAVKSPAQSLLRYAIALGVVAAITWVYFRLIHVNPTTVGFTFLVAVLLVSAAWGLRTALMMATIATAAYNYFFLPPLLTFTIADPQNWVSLFAFLITAIVGSQLSEKARREARQSDQRRREVERLYAFSQQLLVTGNVFGLLNSVPMFVVDSFGVAGAAIFLEEKQKTYFSDATIQSLLPIDELRS
ncbi:MAG TPA: DUF4118 domain-containing protein, partial [Terriglobales bacterium]|nr:DUF4118 domain-containing protein [Terriglobales bacterium]